VKSGTHSRHIHSINTLSDRSIFDLSILSMENESYNSSEIWAQIVDQNDAVMIRLMDLAYPNSLYRFTAQDFVNRVMIKGIIFQVVKIIWPGLQIKHRVLSKVLTLPVKQISSVNSCR
jgi:hypothetical protein